MIEEFKQKHLKTMSKPPITEILNREGFKTVAVLGGGPSLPTDLEALPPDTVYIACNNHAYLYGMETEYMVFKDDPKRKHFLMEALEDHKGITISTLEKYTDYILNVPKYDRGFTGTLACWLACFITQGDVVLCGIDGYTSKDKYFHDGGEQKKAWEHFKERSLDNWRLALGINPKILGCRNPERIYAVSGPLTEIFNEYNKRTNDTERTQ